jgi:hypothetical protein
MRKGGATPSARIRSTISQREVKFPTPQADQVKGGQIRDLAEDPFQIKEN